MPYFSNAPVSSMEIVSANGPAASRSDPAIVSTSVTPASDVTLSSRSSSIRRPAIPLAGVVSMEKPA